MAGKDGLLSSRMRNPNGGNNHDPSSHQNTTPPVVDTSRLRHKNNDVPPTFPTYTTRNTTPDATQQETSSRKLKFPKKKSKGLSQVRMSNIPKQEYSPPPLEDAAEYDKALDFEEFQKAKRAERGHIIGARATQVSIIALVALCAYIVFLIYGVLQTSYVYNEDGVVEPEILSVAELRTLDDYNELSGYYLRIRMLYESVLEVDYNLATDPENSSVWARNYLGLLDEVGKLATDISAIQLGTEYQGIINRMYELVYTHIAVYLQNMNKALEANDSTSANQALQGRALIESEFATLTDNMAALCRSTSGAKNSDIFDWSPSSYLEGLGGEKDE